MHNNKTLSGRQSRALNVFVIFNLTALPLVRIAVLTLGFAIACFSAPALATDSANPTSLTQPPAELLAHYQQIKDTLANSIFGAPIQLNSKINKHTAQGEVFAVLDSPFTSLRQTLSQPAQWCDLAILHINIKTCLYGEDRVKFFVGRKYYQPPDDAFELQYRFATLTNNDNYLNIQLTAPEGPLGTSDYLIKLEAVALDTKHSFIRFEYRYRFGLIGNLAMKTYLATLGRHKVGFTVTGTDEKGGPIFIKGIQGVIERNVMRYIFAIQSVLENSRPTKHEQYTAQFSRWYALIEKHPRQLVELTREEYLENKQRELANQLELQKTTRP